MKRYTQPSLMITNFDVEDMLMTSSVGSFENVRATGEGTSTTEITFSSVFDKATYGNLYN